MKSFLTSLLVTYVTSGISSCIPFIHYSAIRIINFSISIVFTCNLNINFFSSIILILPCQNCGKENTSVFGAQGLIFLSMWHYRVFCMFEAQHLLSCYCPYSCTSEIPQIRSRDISSRGNTTVKSGGRSLSHNAHETSSLRQHSVLSNRRKPSLMGKNCMQTFK